MFKTRILRHELHELNVSTFIIYHQIDAINSSNLWSAVTQ